MNKFVKRLTGAFVGLAMAAGVGVAIGVSNKGATAVLATKEDFDFSGGSFSNNTITWSDDQITIFQEKVSGSTNPNSSYISQPRWYGGNRVTFTPASGTVIDDMTITCGSDGYATALNGGTWTNASHSVSSSVVTVTPTDGASAFTVTLSAQSRISSLSYNYSAASSATLVSIALSGSMNKTAYTTAEDWDPTGLVVTGTYSDDSHKDLTAGATFTYYNSSDEEVATPKDLGTGSGQTLKVVASYTGVSDTAKYVASTTISVTKALEYELVTNPASLTKGTTFMLVGHSTVTKAMQQGRTTSNGASGVADVTLSNSFNSGSVATSGSATIFTLEGSAGAWKIKNGNNQLGFTGTSNNNMQFNESQTDTFKITTQSGSLLSIESNTYSGRKLQYNYNNGSPRFSNYNGGQTYVYMFANIAEVTYGDTDHISVSTLPQTEFAVGETFNSTGLAITAWDGADEGSANSKSVAVTSVSLAGTTFDDEDIGVQSVTVTYRENETNFTCTYNIHVYASATYQLVTEAPSGGWAGSYLITSEVTSATEAVPTTGTYAMKSSLDNFDVVGNYARINPVTDENTGITTVSAGQHLQFSIASITGGYSIQGHSGKYLGWGSSSSNGLTTSDSALVNSISIDAGNVTILCSAGTKGLTLNTTSGQFRYYSNATVKLYKLVESTEAVDYANDFLDMLKGDDPICKVTAQGVVQTDFDDLKAAWELLADAFDGLSTNAIKQQFTLGNADASSENPIDQALALYDHIAYVYGHRLESENVADFDFMGRNITPMQNALVFRDIVDSNTTMPLVVTVAALGTAAAAGFFFFQRKRKEF